MIDGTQAIGRPRSFDELQALDAALELFWKHGYRATTTRALEDGLGVTQSSIYNAFGSKRGLFERALDKYEERAIDALIVPLEQAPDGLESIGRFFDSLAEWVTNDEHRGCLIINLMAEEGGDDDAVTARTRAYRARVRETLRGALARAERDGEITPGWVEPRADLLFGQVMGLNIIARGGGSEPEIRAVLGGIRHLLESWRGGETPTA